MAVDMACRGDDHANGLDDVSVHSNDRRFNVREAAMRVGDEALFTSMLGLKSPWEVVKVKVKVELDTAKRSIDFEVACNAKID